MKYIFHNFSNSFLNFFSIVGAGVLSMLTPHEIVKTRNLGMNAVHSIETIEACPNKTSVDGQPCLDENLSVSPIQGIAIAHSVYICLNFLLFLARFVRIFKEKKPNLFAYILQ